MPPPQRSARPLSARAIDRCAQALPFAFYLFILGGVALGPIQARAIRDLRAQEVFAPQTGLAAFDTVWTRVRDMHYDTLMNGVNWIAVRDTMRPHAEASRSASELRGVLNVMLSRLGESHFTIIPREAVSSFATANEASPSDVPGDVGIEVRLVTQPAQLLVSRVDSGSPAYVAGVRGGWRVMQVDTMSVANAIVAVQRIPVGRARRLAEARLVMRVQAATRGVAGSTTTIDLEDVQGTKRNVALQRRATPGQSVKYGDLPVTVALVSTRRVDTPGGCTGVIRFNTWMPVVAGLIDGAVDSLRSCNAMVLDLRGNTGGVLNMVIGIAGHFLTTPDTLARMKTRTTMLQLVANPRFSNAKGERVEPFKGSLALLVDELTGSTSETFATALRSLGRARIFGDTTAGQALPATTTVLPGGDVFLMAVADIRGPRGERVEGHGVIPDVLIPLTRTGLLSSRDMALEEAIKWATSAPRTFPGGK